MSKRNGAAFGIAGLAVWGGASLFYIAFAGLLEAGFWFYCLNAFAAACAFAGAFRLVARLTRQSRRRRVVPALVFASPGLAGAIGLMWNDRVFPPGTDPASLGRYGAFLLVAYLAVGVVALDKPVRKPGRPRGVAPAR